MVSATVFFSLMHGLIRDASDGMHPFQIAFFRNLFGLIILAPWFLRSGLAPLRTGRIGLHMVRALLNLASMLMFFTALSLIPITEVAALTFSAPIFATVLAVVILGEAVGLRRWAAIALGFLGALVILRPGFATIGPGEILSLASAFLWGFALIVIKTLSRTDSPVTITSYMIVLLIPMSLIPAIFVWQWPSGEQLLYMAAIGMLGTAGHLMMNLALKNADTSVVMPFDFLRLIWVALIGYFAFAEIPDLFTWLGGGMIFASAAYIANRARTGTA
jgi:drug/metabolite transporter (DMT)-like permease